MSEKTVPFDVDKIAALAKLNVEDKATIAGHMADTLEVVEQLFSVDVTGVEPLYNPLDDDQRLREDVVSETPDRATLQSVAPDTQSGYYIVPRVIE